MKYILLGVVGGMVLLGSGCAAHIEKKRPASGANMAICHKGKKTLYVNESAVAAHLRHGDTRGGCP